MNLLLQLKFGGHAHSKDLQKYLFGCIKSLSCDEVRNLKKSFRCPRN